MDLDDLYQETILDHGRKPRNFGKLEGPTHHAEGFNPMCGDRFVVTLKVEGQRIADARFEGQGCAISTASASLMLEAMIGRPTSEFPALFETVHALLTSEGEVVGDPGKLVVFNGVRNFPLRVKCASLAWHTLKAALNREAVASTE
ncbi:MAG: SUF system NifU family Fe-S cluster assembly protein [Deltaproteobacteria bacterium]|nr:SUF system NifU family Fe-S cluster assembly protein [Deltaproteobacteria bacterium]